MGGTHHTGSTTELLHGQSGWNSELHVPSYHPVSFFDGKFKKFPFVWKVTPSKLLHWLPLNLQTRLGHSQIILDNTWSCIQAKKATFKTYTSLAPRYSHAILHWHQDSLQIYFWHPPSAARMLSKAEVGRNGTFMKSLAMLLCDKGGNGCGKISIFALEDRVSSSEGFKKSWSW